MNSPLLSIVIPTKNRYHCLKEVLKTLKTFKNDEIEFVIQDNSDDNADIQQFLNQHDDVRLKYFYTAESLPIVENSDKAILNSKGEYVCFIGDDDMIINNIIDVVIKMKENNIESLIQNPVAYYWNDVTFKYANKIQQPGSFLISNNINFELSKINVKAELAKIIRAGGTFIGDLPKIYHGIVKRELLERVYRQCGTYFPGASPDMASSTALAHFTNNCYKLNTPFSISGKSAISTSGMGVAHTHTGNLEELKFLPRDIIETWDERIPKYWTCSTIWAQSLSTALIACNNNSTINYDRLYANLLIFEPKYKNETIRTIEKYSKTSAVRLKLKLNVSKIFVLRGMDFIRRKLGFYAGMSAYNNVNSIEECFEKVNSLVTKK